MVDDHKIITDGYRLILEDEFGEGYFDFTAIDNCDAAWEHLKKSKVDLILLDLGFPLNKNSKFPTGRELAVRIKKDFPQLKLIIITSTDGAMPVTQIIAEISPEGFMVKGDVDGDELVRGIRTVLEGRKHYSPRVEKMVNSKYSFEDFDHIDRGILYRLSLGVLTKDLSLYIPLSQRGIEDRKRKLRDFFSVETDAELLREARDSGLL